jgi:hypothetical protein
MGPIRMGEDLYMVDSPPAVPLKGDKCGFLTLFPVGLPLRSLEGLGGFFYSSPPGRAKWFFLYPILNQNIRHILLNLNILKS